MQKGDLVKRKAAIEARFAKLEKEKNGITEELYRLQGQYSLLDDLINEFPKEENDATKRRAEKPVS